MGRIITHTGTLTVNFSSLDSDHEYRSITDPNNALRSANASTSTYAQVDTTRGNNAETYLYYKFDTSSLPANATIDSVECKANFYRVSGINSTRFSAYYATMCSGTTEKGTAITIPNGTSVKTFSPGTWTRAELDDVRVKFYLKRTTSNSSTGYTIRIYGGTLTVNYSYQEEVSGQDIFYKSSGSWVPVDTMYVKQNGSWVQVDEMLVKDNGSWTS